MRRKHQFWMTAMRILLAQGHSAEAKNTAAILSVTGGIIDRVRSGHEALMYLQTYEYDIVVLDRSLADGEGSDALRRFRAQGFNVPVLMLADYSTGKSRAQVLRAGADDLMTKPYDADEFLARVEAIVRRRNGFARSVLRVGPLEIDMASREVRVDEQPLAVTRKEYAILELMALRKGRVIPKQAFLDHLYNGLDGPETRVIDVFICNLRKKLANWGFGSLIDTVRGHGYIMRDLADLPAEVVPLMPAKAPAAMLPLQVAV
jgi:two-component system cell cycle response regulator CtrA